jgi:AcrR family transcriptional regulator
VNNTNEKIRCVAFKLFLERGYEATNIRDICKEVGIEAASLYHHYNSKQELFFSIYDDICCENVKYLKEIVEINQPISPNMKLYYLYKRFMDHYCNDLGKQKFLLRYLFFPPTEVSILIQEKYTIWADEKDKIILDIINQCLDKKILHNSRFPNDYLQEYKRFENSQVIEMIISNIKMIDTEIDKLWIRFWNYTMLIGV